MLELIVIKAWGNATLPSQYNNLYVLVGRCGVLVDAGYDNGRNRAAVQEAFDRAAFSDLLITHSHLDHVEAAAQYQRLFDVRLHMHPVESKGLGGNVRYETLQDGQTLQLGDFEIVVLHTPGHSPGHCCFWLPDEGALFSGDLVLGEGSTWIGPPGGNMTRYLESLRRVQQLEIDVLYPAHGPIVLDPPKRISELIDHRLMRESQILDAVNAGHGAVHTIVSRVYAGLDPVRLPLATLTAIAHLEKLLDDQKIHLVGGQYRPIG